MRVAYTAGEAIGPDLFAFYRSIGINLKQLYGSTETAVFVCLQPDHEARADTVGVPIDGVEIKVAETGEVLVRSPGLLKEYYKNPAATAEVLDADGWYHTGDAGFLDAAGHLKIIDRAKDVGRIAGGANDGAMFAPKYVENKLKFFPHIKEAVALRRRAREGLRLHQHRLRGGRQLGRAAQPARTPATPTWRRSPRCCALVRDCVEKVNADLAADERLAGSRSAASWCCTRSSTPTTASSRARARSGAASSPSKYAVLVDALYGGKAEQYIETAGEVRGRPHRHRRARR